MQKNSNSRSNSPAPVKGKVETSSKKGAAEPSAFSFTKRKSQQKRKLALPSIVKPNTKTEIFEKIKVIEKKMSKVDSQFILKSLLKHFVFYSLGESELEQIVIQNMFYCEVKAGDFIFKQNDDASSFFILEKGTIEVHINNIKKKDIQKGEGFGELALLYNAPRSASIKAIDNCTLWGIDRHTFRNAIEEIMSKEYDINRKFIEDVKFFTSLTEDQKDAIASILISQRFSDGQAIINEGDPGSSFYIIKQGVVKVIKGSKEIRDLNKGESFGEQALYYNTARTCSCLAKGDTICLALGRATLMRILGDQIQVIATRNLQKWAFERSKVLSNLTRIQMERVFDAMKMKNYKDGEVILKKGAKAAERLFIIMEGELKLGNAVVSLKGSVWGDEYLKEESKNAVLEADLTMFKDGTLAEILKEKLLEIIGGDMDSVTEKNKRSHEHKMTSYESQSKKKAQSLQLKDLIFIKKLGAGQFGNVFLVQDKEGEFFALKCVSKQQVVEQKLEKHLQQERTVCDLANFPLIMQFMRTFKDDHDVYFLLEYIRGMELFDVIRDIGLLGTYDAQYYIASMILGIEYLHSLNIIYRDIKPENIMVDNKGIMKLIDMGTAKILPSKKGTKSRTFTIIGTPHYMAPEVISGKGYSTMVDLWSIGICHFEFMCGMVPFGEEAEDPYEIYEEIVKTPISYPNYFKDKKAKKLMEQLLSKVPEMRLGGSYTALKANAWFDNIDWDKLLEKEQKPPFIPTADKLINEAEIKKLAAAKKNVMDQILVERKGSNKKPEKSKEGEWDKDF